MVNLKAVGQASHDDVMFRKLSLLTVSCLHRLDR